MLFGILKIKTLLNNGCDQVQWKFSPFKLGFFWTYRGKLYYLV